MLLMVIKLPPVNNERFEIVDTTWERLRDEITRLKGRIETGDELKPQDVKEVKALARQVRDYGVSYRRAVTQTATQYKQMLDKTLAQLGYNQIEEYINQKKMEQNKAIEDRLTAKLDKFNQIVNEELASTKSLQNSSLNNFVSNEIATRFPNLNSGAVSKEIKDWEPVKSVVRTTIQKADAQFDKYPVMNMLPSNAQTMQTLAAYLRTGDVNKINYIKEALPLDKSYIQNMAVQKLVQTESDLVSQIKSVVDSTEVDDHEKLTRIQTLMNAYRSNAF